MQNQIYEYVYCFTFLVIVCLFYSTYFLLNRVDLLLCHLPISPMVPFSNWDSHGYTTFLYIASDCDLLLIYDILGISAAIKVHFLVPFCLIKESNNSSSCSVQAFFFSFLSLRRKQSFLSLESWRILN